MSIFSSYPILCELLPMYDYVDHWCWLMSQLSKKTRAVWQKHRLSFKYVDKATMVVIEHKKILDESVTNYLIKSSILSWMDVVLKVRPEESFKNLARLICGLSIKGYVVPFEIICQFEDLVCSEGIEAYDQDSGEDHPQVTNENRFCVKVFSYINDSDFEYKRDILYKDYAFVEEFDTVEDIYKFLISTITLPQNHTRFYFRHEGEGFQVLQHCKNDKKSTITVLDEDELESISLKASKEITQYLVLNNSNDFFGYDEPEIKTANCVTKYKIPKSLLSFNESFKNLKSITFIQKPCSAILLHLILKVDWCWPISIKMGEQEASTCYVHDRESMFYVWDTDERDFKGIRFNSLTISYNAWEIEQDMKNGYYILSMLKSKYVHISNCQAAYSISHNFGEYLKPKDGFEFCWKSNYSNDHCTKVEINDTESINHMTLVNSIIWKPDIDSWYCYSEYNRMDEFDRFVKENTKASNKDNPDEEKKEDSKEEKDSHIEEKKEVKKVEINKITKILVSKNGRKEAIKREEMHISESLDKETDIMSQILKHGDNKFLAYTIYTTSEECLTKDAIDAIFTPKTISVKFKFMHIKDDEILNYIAEKIEFYKNTLFEVGCEASYSDFSKAFFNIPHYTRAKICNLIRNRKWLEKVFQTPIFGDLKYIHTYQIKNLA